jgi:hypothetical protein
MHQLDGKKPVAHGLCTATGKEGLFSQGGTQESGSCDKV